MPAVQFEIDQASVNAVLKELDRLTKQFDRSTRIKILRKAATPVVSDARANIDREGPDEQYIRRGQRSKVYRGAVSVRYSGGRKGSLFRKKQKGKPVAWYFRGNLRRGIKKITFRRSSDLFVGPKYKKGASQGDFGKTAGTADPYYAQMVFGSAQAFFNKILQPAINKNAGAVLSTVRREVDQVVKQYKSKTGL